MLEEPGASAFTGRIGISRRDITPPVGIYARNWGAATHEAAEAIHRPLTLGALTLRSPGQSGPLVLLEADLGGWPEETFIETIRSHLFRKYSLDESQFLFSVTHTHAGPRLGNVPPSVAGAELLPAWGEELVESAIATVEEALQQEQEATIEWHYGLCRLAATRDLPDPDGDRFICGYNPDLPADTTLLIGRITSAGGDHQGTIVNYACHPTTLAWENRAISPDYVGAMRDLVSQASSDAPVFFLQGASGELAPRYQYVDDAAVADRHGRQLGYAVLAALEDMEPPRTRLVYQGVVESGAPLAVWRHRPVEPSTTLNSRRITVEIPVKDLPSTREIDRKLRETSDRVLAERLRRQRDIRRKLGEGDTYSLPMYGWRIGDAYLVGTMTEKYSKFQTELRRRLGERHIACLNVTNGSIGYLPPEELYDSDIYQVWQTPFDRGSLERVINAAEKMLRDL